jgi:mono/diheme cytochrome c family protein
VFRDIMRLGLVLIAAASIGLALPVRPASAQAPQLPPPAARAVDFARDIAPLFQTACVRCHARGKDKGGFNLETRDRMLKGGDNGPAVVPGQSADSYLITLVAGLEPDNVMPQKGSRLTPAQIGLLRAWIDQGAAWDPSVSFARSAPRNLARRVPQVPETPAATANPVDRLLHGYLTRHGVGPGRRADDRVLVRRLYLDVLGVLPSPDQVQALVADASPDKLDRLIATLLANDRQYAEHWLSFWNDLLRNDYRGTGYIDGGRMQITSWLYAALANNLPYDRFVASLVNPVPGTEGFTKGIVWRGVVNASQTPEMQAAQNISQVFMGVNLKCASCHDSFINDWQLADAYGLASVYADAPLEMVECDRPTGKTAIAKFLYDGLGDIDARAPRPVRLDQMMHALIGPKNGRLARTIVNRLWARFMGHGIVEPVDDMDQAAWHPDLLDWLAEDLAANGYDLKHTIAQILRSQAYQREAVDRAETPDAFVFRGPLVRRLTAEQFVDAIGSVTGVWQGPAAARFNAELMRSTALPRPDRTRAALVPADPLTTALGRPNREQVVTVRQTAATTLQSLELVNGATLAARLRRGAEQIVAAKPVSPDAIVTGVFGRALGRAPTTREREVCRQVLGEAVTAGDVEDLLWSIVMLPEFQLVR